MIRPYDVRKRLLVVIAITMFAIMPSVSSTPVTATAQAPERPPWEPLSPSGPAYKLFISASGTLTVVTAQGIWQSADLGDSWKQVPLPHERAWVWRERWTVAVHPTDPETLWVVTGDSIVKTRDGGTTWSTVLSLDETERPTGGSIEIQGIVSVTVSPADPDLVLVAINPRSSHFTMRRSRDGGATWETACTEVTQQAHQRCWLSMFRLLPHPTDSQRWFAPGGYSYRSGLEMVMRTENQGDDWYGSGQLLTGRIDALASDPTTGRMYLSMHSEAPRPREVSVLRSDDGVTWSSLQRLRMDVTPTDVVTLLAPEIRIDAIAPTPDDSNLVYLGVNHFPPRRISPASGQIVAMYDGRAGSGASDRDMSAAGMGQIYDLAVSPDGQVLYAATENGIWRLCDPANQAAR